MQQQSVLLNDVLTADADLNTTENSLEKHRAGLNIIIRASVTEALFITPENLADIIKLSVYSTINQICERAQAYVENKYQNTGFNDPKTIEKTKRRFDVLARRIRHEFNKRRLALENYILRETYTINHEIFQSGYVRYGDHQGVNYTDMEGARELAKSVMVKEEALKTAYSHITTLKSELQEAAIALQSMKSLHAWLDSAYASGIADSAPKIRELTSGLGPMLQLIKRQSGGLV